MKIIKEENILSDLFQNTYECCGCSACFAICPKHAIIMNKGENGFLYPVIDETKCIRCKLCIKVCDFKAMIKE